MLKVRIIPTLLYKNYGLVKGIGFDSWRRVGAALQSIMVYSLREVDELIFLDITATLEKRSPDFDTIDELADECFMPLTVGGGVQCLDDIYRLLMVGADKVAINSAALLSPGLVSEAAGRFGSQCIIVSIDFKREKNDTLQVYTHAGTKAADISPIEFARQVEGEGAGEILLTSIDRDGTMTGYDLDCIKQVTETVSIPVIASGGAGNAQDIFAAISHGKASAAAAASIFHFTEQTPMEIKQYLRKQGIPVRL